LPAAHLAFLRLQEDEASHPVESLANLELQRNLNRRGYGFDERILRMDRQCAKAFSVGAPYAEVFGLELFGARPPLRDLGAGGEA
jgi:hypothetical protein